MYKLTIRLYQKSILSHPLVPKARPRRRRSVAVYYAYFYDEPNITQIGDFYTDAVPPRTGIIKWDYTFEHYND